MAVRPRTGAIVNNTTIARPREAPAVTQIISRFARIRFVYAIAAKNTGVDPAATRGRTVGFQFSKTIYLRAVMRIAVAIVAEHDAFFILTLGVGRWALGVFLECVPAVDFREHGFHLRIAQVIFRIPPIQRA